MTVFVGALLQKTIGQVDPTWRGSLQRADMFPRLVSRCRLRPPVPSTWPDSLRSSSIKPNWNAIELVTMIYELVSADGRPSLRACNALNKNNRLIYLTHLQVGSKVPSPNNGAGAIYRIAAHDWTYWTWLPMKRKSEFNFSRLILGYRRRVNNFPNKTEIISLGSPVAIDRHRTPLHGQIFFFDLWICCRLIAIEMRSTNFQF